MELIATIVYGGVIGWLASLFMKTDAEQGILANVVIGVIGSILGRFLYSQLFDRSIDGALTNLIVSVLGAAIVIFVWKFAAKKSKS